MSKRVPTTRWLRRFWAWGDEPVTVWTVGEGFGWMCVVVGLAYWVSWR